MLTLLNMDGAILPHQLPASWGPNWKNLTWMSIANAHLVSTIPPEWGVAGAFPELYQLWMYGNPNLTGEAVVSILALHLQALHAWCLLRLSLLRGMPLTVLHDVAVLAAHDCIVGCDQAFSVVLMPLQAVKT